MTEIALSLDNIDGVPVKRVRDRELVALTRGIRAGREADFDRFYDRYMERLYAYLLVLSNYEELSARESLQETFLRVLRYIKVFDSEEQFWAWLTRLARSAWIDLCRRRQKHRTLVSLEGIREPSTYDSTPSGDVAALKLSALKGALEQLGSWERNLIEAFYFEGLSHARLATDLGLTPKAVESRLARIRRKLRSVMERHETTDPKARKPLQ